MNNHNVHKRLYVHNKQLGYIQKTWLSHSTYVRNNPLVHSNTLHITYTLYNNYT